MTKHYNSPDRFNAPWIDAGKHKTRNDGVRRLWLNPLSENRNYWICAVAGKGSTAGDTKESALQHAKEW